MDRIPDSPAQRAVSRRSLLQLGGAVALAGVLTGCSASAAPAAQTLSFTSWIFAGRTVGPIDEAVALYTRATGHRVRDRVKPYSQYLNQLVLTARGGRMTGIAHIDEEWMSTLATAGVIVPLDDVIDSARYPEVVDATGSYQGSRYSMPWTQSAIGLVINKEMLADAGLDPAAIGDIDDFTEALRRLKQVDRSVIPYAPCTDVTQLKDFIPWVWAFGGTVFDGSKVTLGDEGSVRALDYWKMLLDEELIQPGVNRESARTLFSQRGTAIYDDAPQSIRVVPPQASDPELADKMGSLRRPAARGAGKNLIWSQPLVALDDSETTLDALTFFSTGLDVQQVLFEGVGNPPTTVAALESEWFRANAFHQQWFSTVAQNARRNPLWDFPIATSAQRAHDEAIERGLRGTVSTTQALREGKEALMELLHI
jgi:multiple sugar transport system substrate-binding protein